MSQAKVIWNHTMDLASGFVYDMDQDEFEILIQQTHLELTGEELDIKEGVVTESGHYYEFKLK